MRSLQLLQRMISQKASVHSQKWRTWEFSVDDYMRMGDAIGQLATWKLDLFENKQTISDIRIALRKKVKEHPKEKHLAIIDYLQLIMSTEKRERRDIEVGDMTRELKRLAIELNIPIILLSQLSRGVEQRQDKRPLLSDLKESGNIEQDADVVALLYRDDYYNRDVVDRNVIEIILGKQRNGPTGTVKLDFEREYGKFTNLVS